MGDSERPGRVSNPAGPFYSVPFHEIPIRVTGSVLGTEGQNPLSHRPPRGPWRRDTPAVVRACRAWRSGLPGRRRPSHGADVTEAERAERTEAWAQRRAAGAPELTPSRVARLRAILRPGSRHAVTSPDATGARLRALPEAGGTGGPEASPEA